MRLFLTSFCLFSASLFGAIDSKVDRKTVHEAFIPRLAAPLPLEVLVEQPPVERIEKPPLKPADHLKWVPGYWAWDRERKQFEWVCGVWRAAPPGTEWVPGYWKRVASGWYWVSGLWHPSPSQALIAIEPPPVQPEENVGHNKNSKLFWAPGHWDYNPYEKNFRWLGGTWLPLDENWVLFPASWSWRPEGYIFHPAYWDYPLEQRGVAYDCTDKEVYQSLTPEILISRIYYTYPDRALFFMHHYHFNAQFWKECWCVPDWWNWTSWWTLNWQNQWGLWWWWSHPDFPQPSWVNSEVARLIAPPKEALTTLFKGGELPFFFTDRGIPNAAEWLKALSKVTGNYLPLLPEKKWEQAANGVMFQVPQTVLLPTGSTVITDGAAAPIKPVIGVQVIPYDRSFIPMKPLVQELPPSKIPPRPQIIERAPPKPEIKNVDMPSESQEELSPFITRPAPAEPPAPVPEQVIPRPVAPRANPTWIENRGQEVGR